jgi:hypothetical protein
VTERAVKRLISCGDEGDSVDSVKLGDFELVHTADFGAAGVDQFCGGLWAAGNDKHMPFLDWDVMLFCDLASRDKVSA